MGALPTHSKSNTYNLNATKDLDVQNLKVMVWSLPDRFLSLSNRRKKVAESSFGRSRTFARRLLLEAGGLLEPAVEPLLVLDGSGVVHLLVVWNQALASLEPEMRNRWMQVISPTFTKSAIYLPCFAVVINGLNWLAVS